MSPDGLVAATGDMGKLFRLADARGRERQLRIARARFGFGGALGPHLLAQLTAARCNFETRSGNSARPDKTWSDWSEPLTDAQDSLIRSPNARYIQWRASLDGPGAAIENVSVAYLPQNNPPVIRSISVTMQPNSASAQKSAATSSTSAAYSITVTDTGETSTPAGTPTQTLSHGSGSQIQVTWQADDPDGDRLLYSLYFRGEDEKEWKLLRANIAENSLLLDGDVLADGRYYFRVIASDQPSNAANVARTDELVSSPVLIDNTPPVVTLERAAAQQRSRGSGCRRGRSNVAAAPLRIFARCRPVDSGGSRRRRHRFSARAVSHRDRPASRRRTPAGGSRLRHGQQRRPRQSSRSPDFSLRLTCYDASSCPFIK